jgi:hypothetical protein
MDKNENNIMFSDEDLNNIQRHFHALIIKRAKDLINNLKNGEKDLPKITCDNLKEELWFPIPGMYGGFAYQLFIKDEKPVLISDSWCRIVGGSGQKHEITNDGFILIEEGFV